MHTTIPAHHPSAFVIGATVIVLVLLVGTISGRYILRRATALVVVLALVAIFVFDGASPL